MFCHGAATGDCPVRSLSLPASTGGTTWNESILSGIVDHLVVDAITFMSAFEVPRGRSVPRKISIDGPIGSLGFYLSHMADSSSPADSFSRVEHVFAVRPGADLEESEAQDVASVGSSRCSPPYSFLRSGSSIG